MAEEPGFEEACPPMDDFDVELNYMPTYSTALWTRI